MYGLPGNGEILIINYKVDFKTDVNISIYDFFGRPVANIDCGQQDKGNYLYNFKALNLVSGQYYCKVRIAKQSFTNKLNYLRTQD
ncbi:MAG: T9SS type A sorting domain-containing protein [Bacteroidales bacterium]|nr:T9SS type A sorting domain-containing protein [Bacteroidales bacterium]